MSRLALGDRLPLTCTRAGTCCHGKAVWLTPWDVARLAAARGAPVRRFRDEATELGGIRLRFAGPPGFRGQAACALYDPATGCRAHAARPLACRLYPLGRERRIAGAARYMHEGRDFPCLAGCPEVVALPHITVAEYLAGQQVGPGEAVQDAYVELMQDLAEGAFVLLVDSGLIRVRREAALTAFAAAVHEDDVARTAALPPMWLDRLMDPGLDPEEGSAFVVAHGAQLQAQAQAAFATLPTAAAVEGAMTVMLRLALHCGRAAGADLATAASTWLARARSAG